jgi:hypothetical protein
MDVDLETTCRIPRDELLGLLNTMTPVDQQRITAEFAAPAMPAELVVRFRQRAQLTRTRLFVIGASFCVAFALGLVIAMI